MGARERIGPQIAAKNVGASGCYFLSLLKVAEYAGAQDLDDALGQYWDALDDGIMGEDCYVKEPARVLENAMPGSAWTVEKQPAGYKLKPGQWEILRYESSRTGLTFAHFVVGDGEGRVLFDPYTDSLTVRKGELVSKRICTKTK